MAVMAGQNRVSRHEIRGATSATSLWKVFCSFWNAPSNIRPKIRSSIEFKSTGRLLIMLRLRLRHIFAKFNCVAESNCSGCLRCSSAIWIILLRWNLSVRRLIFFVNTEKVEQREAGFGLPLWSVRNWQPACVSLACFLVCRCASSSWCASISWMHDH